MNAHDQRLINEVARVWIEGGGDSPGIAWCWGQIKEAVAELERENDEKKRMETEDENE